MSPVFNRTRYDTAIIGGGIVGLATAREILQRYPALKLVILEKEAAVAAHQSGHNSGVIHAGIYYKPGSLKAKLSVAGHAAMLRFCEERDIPYRRCGKVIVALNNDELSRLHNLYERGQINGVQGLELIDGDRLRELEPHVSGVKAIHSPNTAIVDYAGVAQAYAQDIREAGGEIVTNCHVLELIRRDNHTTLVTTQGHIDTRQLITCAGLYSDRISRSKEQSADFRIVPFRGSYYTLRPDRRHLVNGLVYPVPDPRFPFLGVHFSPTMNGEVWVGPNAVLAFAREGYRRSDINMQDLFDTLMFPGFWKLAATYWRMGALEMFRDYVKNAYVKTAQQYIPELHAAELLPGPSGVRAQALTVDGSLVDDFRFIHAPGVIHVQNAPSPAATASLMIGTMIADEAEKYFEIA
jgi:L-2-hydroxyglutarate oxidase LhgO